MPICAYAKEFLYLCKLKADLNGGKDYSNNKKIVERK